MCNCTFHTIISEMNIVHKTKGAVFTRITINWASAWDFQQCGMCDQQSLRSACAYAQSDQSLCKSLEYYMIVRLLTEHLEFLSLKGGGRGSSESTHVKMPHYWKSHALAQFREVCLILCVKVPNIWHESIEYLRESTGYFLWKVWNGLRFYHFLGFSMDSVIS